MFSARRAAHLVTLVFAGFSLCATSGCGKEEKAIAKIRGEYAAGDYAETAALCEDALRDGVAKGEVNFYYGLSFLATGRDAEALGRFERALEADSALSVRIVEELVAMARKSHSQGLVERATRLARAAVDIEPGAGIGALRYVVADDLFGERNWRAASREYVRALAEYPDTAAAERGYFNLSASLAAAGDTSAAIAALEHQLEGFPRGALGSEARWNLAGILYARGLAEFETGDYDAAAGLARRVLRFSDDPAIVQKARFLIGEAAERSGDFDGAFEQYSAIAEEVEGPSAGLAERARAKIRAFRDAGLLKR